MRPRLLLFILPHAINSWVYLYQEHRVAWALPEDTQESHGLGGGITYAIDPLFCDELLPQFKEESDSSWSTAVNFGLTVVNCAEITDALTRAFNTWASNHKLIAFIDVSDACRAQGAGVNCSHAELYISAQQPKEDQTQMAAYVSSEFTTQRRRRNTAGAIEAHFGIKSSRMIFHTHMCWYLDSTFCASFHSMINDGADAFFKLGLLLTFCFAMVLLAHFAYLILQGARREMHDSGVSVKNCAVGFLDALEGTSLFPITIVLIMTMVPPLFYIHIYVPCVECYDFEAAVAHETGHVLGFHHPDEYPSRNFGPVPGAMGSALCRRSVDEISTLAVRNSSDTSKLESIMLSTTTHRARPCLTSDDLDGLNYLYPVCDLVRQQPPLCLKSKRRSGYLRLLLVCGLPFLIGLVIMQLFLLLATHRQRKRFRLLARDLHTLRTVGTVGKLQNFKFTRQQRSAAAQVREYAKEAHRSALEAAEDARRKAADRRWKSAAHAVFGARQASQEGRRTLTESPLRPLVNLFEPAPWLAFSRSGQLTEMFDRLQGVAASLVALLEAHGVQGVAAGRSAGAAMCRSRDTSSPLAAAGLTSSLASAAGRTHDAYRRMCKQLPYLLDFYVEFDQTTVQHLSRLLQGVARLEEQVLVATREATKRARTSSTRVQGRTQEQEKGDVTGLRGLAVAPLFREEHRASFLRWLVDSMHANSMSPTARTASPNLCALREMIRELVHRTAHDSPASAAAHQRMSFAHSELPTRSAGIRQCFGASSGRQEEVPSGPPAAVRGGHSSISQGVKFPGEIPGMRMSVPLSEVSKSKPSPRIRFEHRQRRVT